VESATLGVLLVPNEAKVDLIGVQTEVSILIFDAQLAGRGISNDSWRVLARAKMP